MGLCVHSAAYPNLSVCLSVRLSGSCVCVSVCLCVCLPVCPSVCLSVCLGHVSGCLGVHSVSEMIDRGPSVKRPRKSCRDAKLNFPASYEVNEGTTRHDFLQNSHLASPGATTAGRMTFRVQCCDRVVEKHGTEPSFNRAASVVSTPPVLTRLWLTLTGARYSPKPTRQQNGMPSCDCLHPC